MAGKGPATSLGVSQGGGPKFDAGTATDGGDFSVETSPAGTMPILSVPGMEVTPGGHSGMFDVDIEAG